MPDAIAGIAYLDQVARSAPRLIAPLSKTAALEDLWDRGLPGGESTGWAGVDPLYTVVPGQLSVVTGWPNSGKSEWVDALTVHLARKDWRIAFYSPENMPVELHLSKLAEKVSGMPFREGRMPRLPREKVGEVMAWLSSRFRLIEPVEGAVTVSTVLDMAEGWLGEGAGGRGLVIDPWNELEHWRPANLSETEYVSATLSTVRHWARRTKTHVWIVAHPQKMKRGEGGDLPIPRPDMISGSQHWWNKADNCLAVQRDFESSTPRIELFVQKIRWKHVGRIGSVELNYDIATGRYFDLPATKSYEAARG